MSETDLELLKRYARDHAEDAFAEIVRRHVGLVYSATLRQVRSPQIAEEVAQSAFTDLARQAHRLAPDTILTSWLYQVTRRTAIDVIRRESRRRLREQIATEMNAMNATTADWTHIEPLLDEAMLALDDTDRAAVLLRYFENKSLREVGQTLGVSDDTAQKRVSRAVERLREFFAKRGVTVGASGLVVAISANAVQAAPAGLAVTISTAAALAGTTIAATAIATVTKTIAMTTLQKTLITATIVATVGTGIYEARQASTLRSQVQTLQQQQAPLTEQIQQLQRERDDATRQLIAVRNETERSQKERKELLSLRALVGSLRRQLEATTNTPTGQPRQATASRSAWKLREPRRADEFQNVGSETPEAAAETLLWAAQKEPMQLLNMVHLPEDLIQRRQENPENMIKFVEDLATRVRSFTRFIGDSPHPIWLEGENRLNGVLAVTGMADGTIVTNRYDRLISFRVTAGENIDDANTQRHMDMHLFKMNGQWKLVIPGISPNN